MNKNRTIPSKNGVFRAKLKPRSMCFFFLSSPIEIDVEAYRKNIHSTSGFELPVSNFLRKKESSLVLLLFSCD